MECPGALQQAGCGGLWVAVPCAAVAPSTVGGGLCVGLSCSCLGTSGVLHEAMSCRAAPAMRSAAAAPTSLGGGICAGCALVLSSCCSPACKSASSVSSSSLDSMSAQVALVKPHVLASWLLCFAGPAWLAMGLALALFRHCGAPRLVLLCFAAVLPIAA